MQNLSSNEIGFKIIHQNLKSDIMLNVKRLMYLGENAGNFIPLIRDSVEMTSQAVYVFLSQLLCSAHSLALTESTAGTQRAGEREGSLYCCLLGLLLTKEQCWMTLSSNKVSCPHHLIKSQPRWNSLTTQCLKKLPITLYDTLLSQQLNVRGCQADKTAVLNVQLLF